MMRTPVAVTVALAAATLLTGAAGAQPNPQDMQQAMTPADVLHQLKEGNERFVRGEPRKRDSGNEIKATAVGPHPPAGVPGCLDFGVPGEGVRGAGDRDIVCAPRDGPAAG